MQSVGARGQTAVLLYGVLVLKQKVGVRVSPGSSCGDGHDTNGEAEHLCQRWTTVSALYHHERWGREKS